MSGENEVKLSVERINRKEQIKNIYRKYGILLIFVLMFIVSALANENFLKITNLVNVIRHNVPTTILACGMSLLVISGNIDLSGGAVLTMAGCFAGGVMVLTGSVPLHF